MIATDRQVKHAWDGNTLTSRLYIYTSSECQATPVSKEINTYSEEVVETVEMSNANRINMFILGDIHKEVSNIRDAISAIADDQRYDGVLYKIDTLLGQLDINIDDSLLVTPVTLMYA